MKEIIADKSLIAKCGLYCGSCRKYLSEKCPGCAANVKAAWCKVRACCLKGGRAACAECATYTDINECKYFNNIFAKFFALVFRSDRKACNAYIKANGLDAYAKHMSDMKAMSIKRK